MLTELKCGRQVFPKSTSRVYCLQWPVVTKTFLQLLRRPTPGGQRDTALTFHTPKACPNKGYARNRPVLVILSIRSFTQNLDENDGETQNYLSLVKRTGAGERAMG